MLWKKFMTLLLGVVFSHFCHAQYLMDMVDTSKEMGRGMLAMYNRLDRIRLSGYIQPEFQVAQAKGTKSYNGGDFSPFAANRFMLRRARVRFDYVYFPKSAKGPSLQFVFQVDATERGVNVRDVWGRIFENKYQLFAFTSGLFARPFSYELNLSSADRESPERGRMSQILMKTERDLGAMISLEPRKKVSRIKFLKIDLGIFNGPGLIAPSEYDSHKDFVGRIVIKPVKLSPMISLGAEASIYQGGILQNAKYIYTTNNVSGFNTFTLDSSQSNLGGIAPRKYYGADVQLRIRNKVGFTELRAEFIAGKQTATINSSETPATVLSGTDGYYIRRFNGAYFYFLQHIGSEKHQFGIKYDWYDPNTDVKKEEIGKTGSNINAANIKFSTLGFGYIYHMNENARMILWYEYVMNEKTSLAGYTTDIKDNVFTCRFQFRF